MSSTVTVRERCSVKIAAITANLFGSPGSDCSYRCKVFRWGSVESPRRSSTASIRTVWVILASLRSSRNSGPFTLGECGRNDTATHPGSKNNASPHPSPKRTNTESVCGDLLPALPLPLGLAPKTQIVCIQMMYGCYKVYSDFRKNG